jgi:hypothetical protein
MHGDRPAPNNVIAIAFGLDYHFEVSGRAMVPVNLLEEIVAYLRGEQ